MAPAAASGSAFDVLPAGACPDVRQAVASARSVRYERASRAMARSRHPRTRRVEMRPQSDVTRAKAHEVRRRRHDGFIVFEGATMTHSAASPVWP